MSNTKTRKKPVSKTKQQQQSKENLTQKKISSEFFAKYEKYLYGIVFLIFLFTFIYIKTKFLGIPLDRDEGDYCMAGKMLLEGATPYIDFYEQKPPGLFFSYAFILALFGKTAAGVQIGFIPIYVISACLITWIGKELFNFAAGVISGLSFLLLMMNPVAQGFTVQAEHLVILFALAGIALFLYAANHKPKPVFYLLSGMALSWSTLIKQNGVFFAFLVGVGIILFAIERKETVKQAAKKIGFYVLGGCIPLLLSIITLSFYGSLNEFFFWTIEFPKEAYVSVMSYEKGMNFFKHYLANISTGYLWIWGAGILGMLLSPFTKKPWSTMVFLIFWGVLSFLSITPGFRFYGHYWLLFFTSLSIGVGAMVYFMHSLIGKWLKTGYLSVATFGLFMMAYVATLQQHSSYLFSPNHNRIVKTVYGGNPFVEAKEISNYLSTIANKDDKILVFGSEPQILFYTGLESVTRHTFPAFILSNHPKCESWRAEYLDDIKKNDPRFIVAVSSSYTWLISDDAGDKFVNRNHWRFMQEYKILGYAEIEKGKPTVYNFKDVPPGYYPKNKDFIGLYERR